MTGTVGPVSFVHYREVSTLRRLSSVGKSTFGTSKLVHYSEVISIASIIQSVLYFVVGMGEGRGGEGGGEGRGDSLYVCI